MSITDPLPEEQSPAGAKRSVVAAFDLDGTLTRGGSVWKFLVFVAGRARVVSAGLFDLAKLSLAVVVGGKANDSAKEALFLRLLAGREASDVSRRAADFGLSHLRRRIRPEVRDRLVWHRSQGHRIVVVSASPELYVGAIATELGADGAIATRLAVGGDGLLTGRYEGKNCRAAEKERRLREWIADPTSNAAYPTRAGRTREIDNGEVDTREIDNGVDTGSGSAPFVWAYGNSAGDLEMLRSADIGVNVGRLGRLGKLHAFRSFASLSADDQPGSDAAPTTSPS